MICLFVCFSYPFRQEQVSIGTRFLPVSQPSAGLSCGTALQEKRIRGFSLSKLYFYIHLGKIPPLRFQILIEEPADSIQNPQARPWRYPAASPLLSILMAVFLALVSSYSLVVLVVVLALIFFSGLFARCLGMVLFVIALMGECGNSWTCGLTPSVSLGIFSTLTLPGISCAAFLSSPSGTLIPCCIVSF